MSIRIQASSRATDGPLLELEDVRTHFRTPRAPSDDTCRTALIMHFRNAHGVFCRSALPIESIASVACKVRF